MEVWKFLLKMEIFLNSLNYLLDLFSFTLPLVLKNITSNYAKWLSSNGRDLLVHIFFLLPSVPLMVSRAENSGSQTQEVMEQVKLLKAQISELEAREKELDDQRALLEEDISFLNHDPLTRTYLFMISGTRSVSSLVEITVFCVPFYMCSGTTTTALDWRVDASWPSYFGKLFFFFKLK